MARENRSGSNSFELENINDKISAIIEEIRKLKEAQKLFEQPLRMDETKLNQIQKMAIQVLIDKGMMTASDVAQILNRNRSSMVINLNILADLGLLDKIRKGKRIYFKARDKEQYRVYKEELDEYGCYLFIVLSSNKSPENVDDIRNLVQERLKDFPGWKIENVSILPRKP